MKKNDGSPGFGSSFAKRRFSQGTGTIMKRPILLLGNPTLRQTCSKVTNFNDAALKKEIADLKEALDDFRAQHGFGRGIAAIQIGIRKRMIALNLGKETFIAINPTIVAHSSKKIALWDDCMSFPSLVVRVVRSAGVSIQYQNEEGEALHWNDLSKAESELLQHELDHLNGILAIDRAITNKDIVYKEEFEKNREHYESMVEYHIVSTIPH
jgi:peptide deformylase